ncbi:MAG: methylmalonyl-CoA epimerase [Haloferacaceae archaeon]
MEFHHAGIATRDADGLADLYGSLFGTRVAHEEEFRGMLVRFLELDGGYLELLEPRDDDGTIASYLDRNGPGLHHFAVATGDIEGALETAREAGVELIDERPRPGAWGHRVAFLHPKSTGGVLFEFVEE